MQNKDLSCTSIEQVVKPRISCPYCQRDYSLLEIRHACHPLAPCDAKARRYDERYILSLDVENPLVAICNECNAKKRRLESAKKGTCPVCEYTGYYTQTEDKLCPSCKAGGYSKGACATCDRVGFYTAKKTCDACARIETTIIAEEVTPVEKKIAVKKIPIKMYLHVVSASSPANGICSKITIDCATEQSMKTDDWFIKRFECEHSGEPAAEFYKRAMAELGAFLRELSVDHNPRWNNVSGLDYEWIKYLCSRYGDASLMPGM